MPDGIPAGSSLASKFDASEPAGVTTEQIEAFTKPAGAPPASSTEPGSASPARSAKSWLRSHPITSAALAILLCVSAIAGTLWWLNARHFETTDDAFIDARQFSISAKVSGYIESVAVTDNERVAAGALLLQIDKRDYAVAVAQAEAQVAQAEASVTNNSALIAVQKAQVAQFKDQLASAGASLRYAQQQNDRYQALLRTGTATVQSAQQFQSQFEQAVAAERNAADAVDAAGKQVVALEAQDTSGRANLRAAQTQLDQAKLNLSYTTVTAGQGGHVAHLSAAKGAYVQAGQSLMMFVPDDVWVTANFKETQIADMRPGQPVDIDVDAYPGRTFRGHVDSIQSGSGTAFSLLPPENATGNYVKVVQRVPVKIVFDHIPQDVVLGPGMSVVPSVKVR